jgi:glycosyltransferase involved in cell wall biosynthesis
MPKVSVVIPAFNTAPYLAETLGSVLEQTYRDFEICVVDDGSTDNTLEVARSFGPPVTVRTQANQGPATARNLAIRQTAGEYIAFLDSDDVWVKDKLAEQVALLEAQPELGWVFGEAQMFVQEADQKRVLRKIGYTADPTFKQLLFGDFIPNSTVVMRRRCVEQIGLLNEARELIGVEDYEYWLRLARQFAFFGIARPLAFYRVRPGNLMGAGQDIAKGLRLPLRVLEQLERQFPKVWDESEVDRNKLFARLHIRAGHAWKQQGQWLNCARAYGGALGYSPSWRVLRWIIAATLLKRWS